MTRKTFSGADSGAPIDGIRSRAQRRALVERKCPVIDPTALKLIFQKL